MIDHQRKRGCLLDVSKRFKAKRVSLLPWASNVVLENVTKLVESAVAEVIGGPGSIPRESKPCCVSHGNETESLSSSEESMLSTELVEGTMVSREKALK